MTDDEFRAAFDQHKDAIYRFAWRMTASSDAADDIAQDVFLALWRQPDRFDATRGRAYLLGVARNLARKRWRDGHRWEELDEEHFVAQPLDVERRETAQIYFGYEVLIEALGKNSYRLTFQPLLMTQDLKRRLTGQRITLDDPSSPWTLLPSPSFPKPQTIQAGDVVALDLLVNKTTGQKIVDYVTIQEPDRRFDGFQWIPPRDFTYAGGSPRDFRLNDVELRLVSPRLTINGELDESSLLTNDTSAGAFVWFYAGGRGRYILSLLPNPELGFRKAGEVRGTSLRFTMGKDTFTLNAAGPIAPGRAPFNLYVLHDPGWRPNYPHANLSVFVMDGADRAELLVKPRP